eukprot:2736736-Rhodomonas_salina.3
MPNDHKPSRLLCAEGGRDRRTEDGAGRGGKEEGESCVRKKDRSPWPGCEEKRKTQSQTGYPAANVSAASGGGQGDANAKSRDLEFESRGLSCRVWRVEGRRDECLVRVAAVLEERGGGECVLESPHPHSVLASAIWYTSEHSRTPYSHVSTCVGCSKKAQAHRKPPSLPKQYLYRYRKHRSAPYRHVSTSIRTVIHADTLGALHPTSESNCKGVQQTDREDAIETTRS